MSGSTLIPTHLNQHETAYSMDDAILESQDRRLTCAAISVGWSEVSSFAGEPFASSLWEAWSKTGRRFVEFDLTRHLAKRWSDAIAVMNDTATEERIRYTPVAEEVAAKAQDIVRRLDLGAEFSPLTTHTVPENGRSVTFTVMEIVIPAASYGKETVERVYEALGEGLSENEDKALSTWVIPGE